MSIKNSDMVEHLRAELREYRQRVVALEQARHHDHQAMRRKLGAGGIVLALVTLFSASVASTQNGFTVPHVFNSNTPARAQEVNENFGALASAKVGKAGDTMTGALNVEYGGGRTSVSNGTIMCDHESANYDLWVQGSTATTGDARNLALLGHTGSDSLYINYDNEYKGGVVVGGTTASASSGNASSLTVSGNLQVNGATNSTQASASRIIATTDLAAGSNQVFRPNSNGWLYLRDGVGSTSYGNSKLAVGRLFVDEDLTVKGTLKLDIYRNTCPLTNTCACLRGEVIGGGTSCEGSGHNQVLLSEPTASGWQGSCRNNSGTNVIPSEIRVICLGIEAR